MKKLSSQAEVRLTRVLCTTLFLAVASTAVDIWWHGTIGRESLFIPPHIALYTTVGVSVILGLFGWFRNRDLVWRRIAIILVAIPVVAPFDDFWHRTFGQESVVSPLIVWSPAHVVLALAIAASFLLLLPAIDRDTDVHGRRLFGALAWGSMSALTDLIPLSGDYLFDSRSITLGWRVALFTLVFSVMTGIAFGVVPAIRAARLNIMESLKTTALSIAGGRRQRHLAAPRNLLVVGQIALAIVLLVGAGLMLKSFARLQAVDTGFRPLGLLTFRVEPDLPEPVQETRPAFKKELLERVASIPGVDSATLSNCTLQGQPALHVAGRDVGLVPEALLVASGQESGPRG